MRDFLLERKTARHPSAPLTESASIAMIQKDGANKPCTRMEGNGILASPNMASKRPQVFAAQETAESGLSTATSKKWLFVSPCRSPERLRNFPEVINSKWLLPVGFNRVLGFSARMNRLGDRVGATLDNSQNSAPLAKVAASVVISSELPDSLGP